MSRPLPAGSPAHAPAPGAVRSLSASSAAVLPPENGALVSIGKFVDTPDRRAVRLASFAAKRTAANLLYRHDEKWSCRVAACGYVAHAPSVDLRQKVNGAGAVSASLNGLVSCKSVWACPVCSARISLRRRDEMNALLAWSRSQGHAVVMLTLTARHNSKTALSPFLSDLKEALRRLRQSRGWRGLPLVGSVTASEVTHGRNGWHPHLHVLLILDAPSADALAAVEGVRAEWSRSLVKLGRDGNGAAFQVQQASAAGDYVSKFGAADEIALGRSKSGRAGSRSPWQLLADAAAGDKRACALWVEFAVAFKGKSQLQWSRGLKALSGVLDVTDEDACEAVTLRAWAGKSDGWRSARLRRCALVGAAESGADLDAAEFGPTDAERWRSDLASSDVIEDESGAAPAGPPACPVRPPSALSSRALSVVAARSLTDARALSLRRPSRAKTYPHAIAK